jgi:hypothetical protein
VKTENCDKAYCTEDSLSVACYNGMLFVLGEEFERCKCRCHQVLDAYLQGYFTSHKIVCKP